MLAGRWQEEVAPVDPKSEEEEGVEVLAKCGAVATPRMNKVGKVVRM